MVMRGRPVGRERPGGRLALRGGMPDRVVWPGRSAWSVAATAVLVAMASGATIPAVAGAAPPPGRAYELVSPADHLAGAVPGLGTDLRAMPGLSSDDGNGFLFGAGGTMGPNWSGPSNPMIFARRTESGWQVRSAIRSLDEGNTAPLHGSTIARSGWLTKDGREFVFGTADLVAPPGTNQFGGVFRSSDALEPPEWLSRPNVGAPAGGVEITAVTAGDDTRTVAFQSSASLTADAPPTGTQAVYVRRGGELRLASIDPDGNPFTQRMNLANSFKGHNASNPPASAMRNQVAGNGRFVLMVDGNNESSRSLFVRDLDAGVTRQLAGPGASVPLAYLLNVGWGGGTAGVGTAASLDELTVPPGFVFGARDAARAFFNPGTGVGGTPLAYEANLETGTVTARTAITGPPMGLSHDGEHMLFLQPPVGEGGLSPRGDWTLRYWSAANPNTSVAVGTIAWPVGAPARPLGLARVYRSSADGRTWIFAATGSPDPARLNVVSATAQLYRWTVGDAKPTCLTCEPTDGTARTSGVSLTVQESIVSERFLAPTTPESIADNKYKDALAQRGHSLSDDGRWLLFDSPDRLVSEDGNDVRDVYLWDRDGAAGGQLQLVTSGQGTSPSYALDLDPTGRNAFFTTREGLIRTDDDGAYDVYVARVGGGFPEPPESCVGEACRPPVVGPSPVVAAGSPLVAPVTVGRQKLLKSQKRRVGLRVRKGKATSLWITLKVRTPGSGTIRVRGKGLRQQRRTAKRSTTYSVRVKLSKHALRTLRKQRRVRVRASVRFAPEHGKAVQKTVKWTIKRGARSSRKGR